MTMKEEKKEILRFLTKLVFTSAVTVSGRYAEARSICRLGREISEIFLKENEEILNKIVEKD